MTRRNATVRELVEELAKVAPYLGTRDAVARQHHVRTVRRLTARLEQLTAPQPAPAPKLPGRGTVAWHVLALLDANRTGYDHDHVRMLTGLTDAELCVAIVGAGPSTVRPRRVDLTKAGLVEAISTAGGSTRWTISDLARELLQLEVRRAG